MNDPLMLDQHRYTMSSFGEMLLLNSNPDTMATIYDGLAIGGPSPHLVILQPTLRLQMMEEMEEKWYQLYDK
ncbi:hypothetical protein L873DRAFT_1812531 [Choiromyces venosus 120613-1]|uniref:Uncharacterized protein n=1 Tax=Choiromyces venosus 120613-1 TaxID=1336337 RepID=A0A3N4JBV0_9PEZI|nr:hypothetical protein L873DRAFT_1812531 [Choiromyces venosus 120613-1]